MLKKDIIIIPTYNEKLNIRLIYDRIRNNNSTSEILFIDDNSPDGTSQEIKKLINVDSKVHILSRENKLGIWQGKFIIL